MIQPSSIMTVHTTWGRICIRAVNGRIVSCDIPIMNSKSPGTFSIRKIETENVHPRNRTVLRSAEKFSRAVLAGMYIKPPAITFPQGTKLQQAVWKYLYGMKKGQFISYGKLAAKIGYPKAARAIGQACGANAIPLFIPCHRVLGSHGAIGGFSCGLSWKYLLLKNEAAELASFRRNS